MKKTQKSEMFASQSVKVKDEQTGEWQEAKLEMKVTLNKPKLTIPFTMLMQGVTLAMIREISPSASKLLLYLISVAEYKNIICKPPYLWAADLKYSSRQIFRATNELINMGLLFKSKDIIDKRISVYKINPLQSWKGTEIDRKKTIREEYNPQQLDLFKNLSDDSAEKHQYTLVDDKYLPKKITQLEQRKTMENNRDNF
jgi:hypothetical protein